MCGYGLHVISGVFDVFNVQAALSSDFLLADAPQELGALACEHRADDQLEPTLLLFLLELPGEGRASDLGVRAVEFILLSQQSHVDLHVDWLLHKRVRRDGHALGLLKQL